MAATRNPPITIPCKYRTGKILGNGTYATVKGEKKETHIMQWCKVFLTIFKPCSLSPEAMHVSFICL